MKLCIECHEPLDTLHYYNCEGPYCGRCVENVANVSPNGEHITEPPCD